MLPNPRAVPSGGVEAQRWVALGGVFFRFYGTKRRTRVITLHQNMARCPMNAHQRASAPSFWLLTHGTHRSTVSFRLGLTCSASLPRSAMICAL